MKNFKHKLAKCDQKWTFLSDIVNVSELYERKYLFKIVLECSNVQLVKCRDSRSFNFWAANHLIYCSNTSDIHKLKIFEHSRTILNKHDQIFLFIVQNRSQYRGQKRLFWFTFRSLSLKSFKNFEIIFEYNQYKSN